MQNQVYVFIAFILNGILIGIIFDLFRVLRKSFKTSDIVTYIEDIIFGILSGLLVLFSIMKFNNGEIRFYIFLGIVFGLSFYLLVFSKTFIDINVYIIKIIKKAIIIPTIYIIKTIKKIIFKSTIFVCLNAKKIFKFIKISKIKHNNVNVGNNI